MLSVLVCSRCVVLAGARDADPLGPLAEPNEFSSRSRTHLACWAAISALDAQRKTHALDRDLERLARAKAELVAALRSPQHEDFVDASVRQFCASANARSQACADFDAKRQFLVGHVERVIYNRYKITIVGSVPVQPASGVTKLQFRIEGEIDQKAVRSRPLKIPPDDGRWKEWKSRKRSTASRPRASARSRWSTRRSPVEQILSE